MEETKWLKAELHDTQNAQWSVGDFAVPWIYLGAIIDTQDL